MNEGGKPNTSGQSQPNPHADAWESLYNESRNNAEQVINSKTNKTRTFSEWDRYPIVKGEKPKDFGERTKKRHQMEAEFGSMPITDDKKIRTEEYLKSKQGQQELAAEQDFDKITDQIEQGVADGKYTREQADKLQEQMLERTYKNVSGIRQEFEKHQQDSNEFLAPTVIDQNQTQSAEDFYPPALPELPEQSGKSFQPPAVVASVEKNDVVAPSEKWQQTGDESIRKQRELAMAALDGIDELRRQELHTLEEAYQKNEIDKKEFDAKMSVLNAFVADRINKVASDYNALRDDPDLQKIYAKAADIVKQSDRTAQAQKNESRALEGTQAAISGESQNGVLELEDKSQIEGIEKAKLEAEEKAKLEAMEKAKQTTESTAQVAREAATIMMDKDDARIKDIEETLSPLAAINADFAHDKKELAHDYAERELNAETAKANLIQRIWKGNLFKKYYEKKYEKEILAGKREVVLEDGSKKNLEMVIRERSHSAISRFTIAAADGYANSLYVHRGAGEEMNKADRDTTKAISNIIKQYANDWAKNNTNPDSLKNNEDIKREFNNSIREELAKLKDASSNGTEIDNYYDVAVAALGRAEVAIQASQKMTHEIAIDRVMEGFKVYNAEVRNNIRSKAHRDNLDKIINKLESSKIGSIIPPEMIAGVVGTAAALTQTGIRAAAGAAGGIGISGIMAGLRERNRVTEDRVRMMRDAAIGLEYDSSQTNRAGKKRAKYEKNLYGTLYDTRPATELTANIEKAIDSQNALAIMRAIAEARVRVNYSDSESKDLITYTSADSLGDERTRLDIALIRAERSLPEEYRDDLDFLKVTLQRDIERDNSARDRDYRKLRTAQAVKQAGKTIAIGAAFFIGSQELIAAFDPHKIGILEKTGILKTTNSEENTTETLLAQLARPQNQDSAFHTTEPIRVKSDQEAKIKELEEAGYTRTEITPAYQSTKSDIAEVSPADSTHALRVNTSFADNGTKFADGNELGLHLENGRYIANMNGSSTMGNDVFDYQQLVNAGKIRGHITIGGGTFEVASEINASGQVSWPIDATGSITTTTGETIKAFGANGEKLFKSFRVVVDNGVDSEGVRQVVSLASDAGADSFAGKIQQVVETIVEEPAVYEFTKTIADGSKLVAQSASFNGIIPPVFTSRTGLGEAEPVTV